MTSDAFACSAVKQASTRKHVGSSNSPGFARLSHLDGSNHLLGRCRVCWVGRIICLEDVECVGWCSLDDIMEGTFGVFDTEAAGCASSPLLGGTILICKYVLPVLLWGPSS